MNKRQVRTLGLMFSLVAGTVLFVILAGEFTWYVIAVISIVALFLILAISKMIIYKNDLVEEDEYSKQVVRVASARSFTVSLYMWGFILVFSNIIDDMVDAVTKVGIGIVLMGLIFLINMIIIKIKGLPQ